MRTRFKEIKKCKCGADVIFFNESWWHYEYELGIDDTKGQIRHGIYKISYGYLSKNCNNPKPKRNQVAKNEL